MSGLKAKKCFMMAVVLLGGMVLFGNVLWAEEVGATAKPARNAATINADEFRDKIHGCWLGKNVGGTLGQPFECKGGVHNIDFYTRLKIGGQEYSVGWNESDPRTKFSWCKKLQPGKPIGNDDLDLQLLWLKAMEDHNGSIDASTLGEYWLKHNKMPILEYGVGMANFARGILPPLSGHYKNKCKDSNGAWIRSEIWACLAPGNPRQAANWAWLDASFDHGVAEGTYAAVFIAVVESAAFVEQDKYKLIQLGLSSIPADCLTAKAVRLVLANRAAGKTWQETQHDVYVSTQGICFLPAPRNIAYILIGWLYGDDDFGKSLCTAVNCGDDADCTGATLGSIMGILHGKKGIPEKWLTPIGDSIVPVILKNFTPPATAKELTDRVFAMQAKVAGRYGPGITIAEGPTQFTNPDELLRLDKEFVDEMWKRSPYVVSRINDDLVLSCDYGAAPEIKPGGCKSLKLIVKNKTGCQKKITLAITGLPEGYVVSGLTQGAVELAGGGQYECVVAITASQMGDGVKFMAELNDNGTVLPLQLGLVNPDAQKK